MFPTMSPGEKRSFTLSAKNCFIDYMRKIHWDDSAYDSQHFIYYWLAHSKEKAAWYNSVKDQLSSDPATAVQLQERVNSVIQNVIETPPTDDQIQEIETLINEYGLDDIDYCCRAEADFVLDQLKQKIIQN